VKEMAWITPRQRGEIVKITHYNNTVFTGPSRGGGGKEVSYPGPRSVGGAPRSLGSKAACRGPRE